MPDLRELDMQPEPQSCIRSAHWKQAGLDVPLDVIVSSNKWLPVLKFLRAGPTESVHELRLMFIGDGEVGKTSLVQAFHSKNNKAERISKEQRTVGIDMSPLEFPPVDAGAAITCQVCDFAGQEIYYLSHTLHFTRRCLYVLMWTTHKFSADDTAKPLDVEDIVAPLRRWLQLLATNVPDANVLVVGTHCRVDPGAFDSMRSEIDERVHEEMRRLRRITSEQARATREVFEQQQITVNTWLERISQQLALSHPHIEAPRPHADDVHAFIQKLSHGNFKCKPSLRQHAKSLRESVLTLENTRLRLGRLHGVYDGSVPPHSASAASLKLVSDRSFAVDSVEGVGVAELKNAIEATCRDPQALPFMGEKIPKSWLQVAAALQQPHAKEALGDSVLPLRDAVAKLVVALRSAQPVEGLSFAQHLQVEGLQDCLEFWSVLGRVFVHDGHFMRDPCLIIELLKPLVHHDVLHHEYREKYCTSEPAHFGIFDELLGNLQQRAVLDHRLLSHYKAWPRSDDAVNCILSFFKQCFMISSLSHESVEDSNCSLVTARLCDPTNGKRQAEVRLKASVIEATSDFFAVYVVPSKHIGIVARMQATIEALRPKQIHLEVAFGDDNICIQDVSGRRMELMAALNKIRLCGHQLTKHYSAASSVEEMELEYNLLSGETKEKFPISLRRRCCVSVRSLDEVSNSPLSSLCQKEIVRTDFSHALVVSSNNDGLFAFAASCIDDIIRSGAFGSLFQSWLPCRPQHGVSEGVSWFPEEHDWALLSTVTNPISMSKVLSTNANRIVLESDSRRLKDLLPRKPPIFMSHTYSGGDGVHEYSGGDGTHKFCKRLMKKLQSKLLCTVWLDKNEQGSGHFHREMQVGMSNAGFFIICLTPLYLTRSNCLRELRWALDMCLAKDSKKKMVVLPLHPAVSLQGCKTIIKASRDGRPAHVFLPVDDRNKQQLMKLDQLKGHKLSGEAIQLLKLLTETGCCGIDADWIKLQPWRSDELGKDWEEVSVACADDCATTMDDLLACSFCDILACISLSKPSTDFRFHEYTDEQLVSDPPSQTYLPCDVAIVRECYRVSLFFFAEQELVALVLMGLSDADIMTCVQYGLDELCETQVSVGKLNPVNINLRISARMSGVDFHSAGQKLTKVKQQFSSSCLFLDLDELLKIISSPTEEGARQCSGSLDFSSVISDSSILQCIIRGEACGALEFIRGSSDLNALFVKANQKWMSQQEHERINSVTALFFSIADVVPLPSVKKQMDEFYQWLGEPEIHVVCRGEGYDDAVLLDALMDWSHHVTRLKSVPWNDFSYKGSHAQMQFRLANVPEISLENRTGVCAFQLTGSINHKNDSVLMLYAASKCRWIDVVDGDLNAPVRARGPEKKSGSRLYSCFWQCRGIENMLLPASCPLWFVQNRPHEAADRFREVFQRLSANFLGPLSTKSHSIFTAARNAGPGWMGWHKLALEQINTLEHAPTKMFLQHVISKSLGPGNSIASSMLVLFDMFVEACAVPENDKAPKKAFGDMVSKYAPLFSGLSEGQLSSLGLPGPENPFLGLEPALTSNDEASLMLRQSIPGQKDAKFKVSKEARTAFWKRNESPEYFFNAFPRFVCFVNSLCCVENVDENIRKASLTCVSAVFRVLCASVFGLQDEDDLAEGINCIMFNCSTSLCDGYLPRSDSLLPSGGTACMCCNRPHADHLLKHTGLATQGSSDAELQFMRLVCRVGSMGWDSHSYMTLVHSESHLSGQFNKENIEAKQQSFRQHLCLNIFGTHPSGTAPEPCELCRNKSLVEHELPEIVRLELEHLRKERASELLGLVAAADSHFAEAARYAELLGRLEVDSSSLTDKAAEQSKGILTKLKDNPHQITSSEFKFCTEQFKLSEEDATLLSSSATTGSSAKAKSLTARGIRSTGPDCKLNAFAEQEKAAVAKGPLVSAPAPAPALYVAPDCAEARQSQALAAGQSAAAPDDDKADLDCLVAVLARAKVLPVTKRPDFARKLLDQGVSDERAIWTSLSAHPPDFDLVRDIGMTPPQQRSLDTYLKNLEL